MVNLQPIQLEVNGLGSVKLKIKGKEIEDITFLQLTMEPDKAPRLKVEVLADIIDNIDVNCEMDVETEVKAR